jgi:hypothetical protein
MAVLHIQSTPPAIQQLFSYNEKKERRSVRDVPNHLTICSFCCSLVNWLKSAFVLKGSGGYMSIGVIIIITAHTYMHSFVWISNQLVCKQRKWPVTTKPKVDHRAGWVWVFYVPVISICTYCIFDRLFFTNPRKWRRFTFTLPIWLRIAASPSLSKSY